MFSQFLPAPVKGSIESQTSVQPYPPLTHTSVSCSQLQLRLDIFTKRHLGESPSLVGCMAHQWTNVSAMKWYNTHRLLIYTWAICCWFFS